MEPCKVILGNRGSSKTEGLKHELLNIAKRRDTAVVVVDRPGTLARDMVGHLSANGMEHRTVYDRLSRTDRVFRFPFIRNSTLSGDDAVTENELEYEQFTQIFYAKRGLRTGEQKPYTKEYLDIVTAIYRSQRHPKPF